MKKLCVFLLIFFLSFALVNAEDSTIKGFSDVPVSHWSYPVTHKLRDLGVTTGIGNHKFGLEQPITRGEFITFLVRLMEWDTISRETSSFNDTKQGDYYYEPVETALEHRVIEMELGYFRPEKNITREEMAIMIVRALGYDSLARQLNKMPAPFEDVKNNIGYITIARDLGIIQGQGNNLFDPEGYANREHAAAMIVRMYDLLNNSVKEIHGFYAIQSYAQKDLIPHLDSVSFGWSRLEFNEETKTITLNKTRTNDNIFAEPVGSLDLIEYAKDNKISTQLMVFAENVKFSSISELGLIEYILKDSNLQNKVIELLVNEVSSNSAYDGIVLDFELMRGNDLAKLFNEFLYKLKEQLNQYNKKLYVTVHPVRKPGEPYFDGYDFKTIGEVADRVILMAHDYSARKLTEIEMNSKYTVTPLTPIDEIYYSLKAITNELTGIKDRNKIWLQLSFDSAQWKIKDNKIINEVPFRPTYDIIYNRMLQEGVTFNYSKTFENPYITFYNNFDETENVLWYEDSRSINAKIELANLFNINGISLWRLGNVPNYSEHLYLDVWQQILDKNSL